MKRTLAIGGVAAGLLASAAIAAPAQADSIPSVNLAKTNFAAQQVAAFWLGQHAANLINATPYAVETTIPAKHVSTGGASADSKPGVVGSSGDQKASTGKSKNVNLPKTVGKVFFIGADHKPHWCSATAVQSQYKNLVATAGHCVYDTKSGKETLDKWVFVPGYYNGKTPWGIYVGKTAYTHYDYDVYEDGDRDYAFVTVYNGVQVTNVSVSRARQYVNGTYPSLEAAKAAQEKLAKETGIKARIVPVANTSGHKVDTKTADAKAAPATRDQIARSAADYPTMENAAKAVNGVGEFTYSDGTWGGKVVRVANWTPEGWSKDGKSYTFKKDGATYTATYWALFPVTYKLVGGSVNISLKDVGSLGSNVGGQGLAYNQKIGTAVFEFGYPSGSHPDGNFAFTGKTLKWAYGKTFKAAAPSMKAEELVGIKSSFTGEGSIGSPWLYRYSSTKRLGYLNGVTIAVSDTDGNGRIDTNVSPYFDGETLAVYKTAAKNWSGKIV